MVNLDRFLITHKIILYILPILTLIGIIIPLILNQLNLVVLGSYIAIPMVLTPIIYIFNRKNIKEYFTNNKYVNLNSNKRYCEDHWFSLLVILYVIGFSISIIILDIFEIRPFAYYGLITFMATFILLEILLFDASNKKVTIILFQIALLALNIVWSATLKYYYFIGRTDSLVHAWYIYNLITEGFVTGVFNLYQHFPMWHLMIASAYLLLNINLPIYKVMYFINGLNFTVIILVIYLISLKLFKDKKIALMSSLFASINSDMIITGMYSIPRSSVSLLEALLILLILSLNIKKVFLIIFLTFIIIIYHTVSMPFIISILLIIYFLQKLYNSEKNHQKFLTSNYLLLAIIATVANYIFNGQNVFVILIKDIVNPGVTGIITKSIVYSPLNELFNYLQYSLLFFFILIGILAVLDFQRFSGFEKIFCLTGFLLVSVTFPGPALLSNKFSANLNIARFGEYAPTLIVIVAAVGFIGIFYSVRTKLKGIIIILFIIMTLFSVSNDFSASDNPLVKRVFYTFYLTEQEIVAINQFANITNGYVMSDYVFDRYLQSSKYSNKTNILEIDVENRILKNTGSDNILIRNEELRKRPVRLFRSLTGEFQLKPNEKSYDYYYSESIIWSNLEKHNKIYNSGGLSGYN